MPRVWMIWLASMSMLAVFLERLLWIRTVGPYVQARTAGVIAYRGLRQPPRAHAEPAAAASPPAIRPRGWRCATIFLITLAAVSAARGVPASGSNGPHLQRRTQREDQQPCRQRAAHDG